MTLKKYLPIFLLIIFLIIFPAIAISNETIPKEHGNESPETCTYNAYYWSSKLQKTVDHFSISKPYSELTDDEKDPLEPRCTVCREDQRTINPKELGLDLPEFKVCYIYHEQLLQALKNIIADNSFTFNELTGYRPGKTRGKIVDGKRTEWSNHSFGTAIDINSKQNAIYSNCNHDVANFPEKIANCKKGIGGAWNPQKKPKTSITKDSIVYKEMTKFWKWGAEIPGNTKDIMHFSISGF